MTEAKCSSILKRLSFWLQGFSVVTLVPLLHGTGRSHKPRLTINSLLNKLLLKILEYASHYRHFRFFRETRDTCALVCRRWHNVTLSPDFWKDLHISLQIAIIDEGLPGVTVSPSPDYLVVLDRALDIVSSNAQHIHSTAIFYPARRIVSTLVVAMIRILEYSFPFLHHPYGTHPIEPVQTKHVSHCWVGAR
jgi:hypothetical protein